MQDNDQNENGPGASRAAIKEINDVEGVPNDAPDFKGPGEERHPSPARDEITLDAEQAASSIGVIIRYSAGTFAITSGVKTNGKPKYKPANDRAPAGLKPLQELDWFEAKRQERIERHVEAGPHLAVFLIKPGSDQTRLGGYDLDNKGSLTWDQVAAKAREIVAIAKRYGLNAWAVRSGSGKGIHIFFRFDDEQPAVKVRSLLRHLLAEVGLREGDGDKDLSEGEVEIFPKQDEVAEGGYGSHIAVPFGRRSVPLDSDLQPCASPLPFVSSVMPEPKPAALAQQAGEAAASNSATVDNYRPTPEVMARALSFIDNKYMSATKDGARKFRVKVGYALARAGYDPEVAFTIFHEWVGNPAAHPQYQGERKVRETWKSNCKGKNQKGWAIWSIRHHAVKAGWKPQKGEWPSKPELAGGKDRRDSKQDVLMAIIEGIELFHDDDGNAFADLTIDGHRETWPVRSAYFKRWLRGLLYDRTGSAVDDKTETIVIKTAEAKAFKGLERKVFLRIANKGNAIYHDLGDKAWRAVKITAQGWDVVDAPEVRFTRMKQMRALPDPVRGGSIDDLRPLLNVDDNGFLLTKGWLLGALSGRAPYVIMGIIGEQGTAKSTYSRLMRNLIDPYDPPLRNMPGKIDDLFIAAYRSYVVSFNNVSSISYEMSDALCQISVDGGYGKRQLYTDLEEVLLKDRRPIIINAITNVYTRSDFLDRSIILTLDPIPDDKRREEEEINKAFEAVQARVLGALYDKLSAGLRRLSEMKLTEKPRMADFAKWVSACLGEEANQFMAVYVTNRDEAQHELLEDDPVANVVIDVARDPLPHPFRHGEKQTKYRNMAELLKTLNSVADKDVRYSKSWPDSPKKLGNWFKRMGPNLRKAGVVFMKHSKSNGEEAVSLYAVSAEAKDNLGSGPRPSDPYEDAVPENEHASGSSSGRSRTRDPNDDGTPM